MRAKPGTICCPHCTGRSGFVTNIVFKAKRLTTWDGEDVDTDNYVVVSETDARCIDCGKSVRSAIQKDTP